MNLLSIKSTFLSSIITDLEITNFLLLTSLILLTFDPFVESNADAKRRDDYSFRGPIPEDLHIPNWDLSGTTDAIPTAHDFLRLIQPFPLAYGGMFTNKPISFDQWSIEIGFRIHGGLSNIHHGHHNTTNRYNEFGEVIGKGGRGLAFWYSKTANPTPIIAPSNPAHHAAPRPSLAVPPFPDPLDHSVSFFGGPTSFDGLAVVIDNQPSTPLTRRSDRKHWGIEDGGIGAEEWSVISGVFDDGKGNQKWLEDRLRKELTEDEEAAYLNHTLGDCQVSLRNAPGLIWLKITYISNHLSVSLDLSPHTTLSGQERHYDRECFKASNVKLPRGYYMGLTALASPNEEADNIDVYAIEVKEVKGKAKDEDQVVEHYKEEHVAADDVHLEGTTTSQDPNAMLLQSINAQRAWHESIKHMSEKLDVLQKKPSHHANQHQSSNDHHDYEDFEDEEHMLKDIEHKLDTIIHKIDRLSSPGLSGSDKPELIQKIFDLEEQSNRHEMFLSEQIEELRSLILESTMLTSSKSDEFEKYEEDHSFKPLEHQHDTAHQKDQSPHTGDHKKPLSMVSVIKESLKWLTGALVIFILGYKIGEFHSLKRRRNGYQRFDTTTDEGSFMNPASTTSSSPIGFIGSHSGFGFKNRSKKMI
ncbi:hypothetical protein O181_051900 [Austropuccinia psidii MF-1]|uniref:L-type lectin-like domain-containing protein n=1 Tax=Austropuccinia psidii MF-1 TaxID=1389203 RepID=A0A9Q3HS66_9BASI|nr:hypothetical protein [Austropuccinia psidii MF-1]